MFRKSPATRGAVSQQARPSGRLSAADFLFRPRQTALGLLSAAALPTPAAGDCRRMEVARATTEQASPPSARLSVAITAMEGVAVEGETISAEEYEDDAGWLTSHRRRNSRALSRLGSPTKNSAGNLAAGCGTPARPPQGQESHRLPKRLRQPRLPKEDIKIVIRPRDGLDVTKVSDAQLRDSVFCAAEIPSSQVSEDILRSDSHQNIIIVSTPALARAEKYNKIRELRIGDACYATCAYIAPPEDTSKGVIHDIPSYDTAEDITRSLVYSKNPTVLQARRMGKTNSVIIVFEGQRVPYFVYYRGAEYRCFLHKKKYEVCATCGTVGHRMDVCPHPDRQCCKTCALPDPTEDHACEIKCALCGKDHPTGDKKCPHRYKTPFVLRQRQRSRQQRDQRASQHPSDVSDRQQGTFKSAQWCDEDKKQRGRSSSFPRLRPLHPGPENGAATKDSNGSHCSRSKSRRKGGHREASRSASRSSHMVDASAQAAKVSWATLASQPPQHSVNTHNTSMTLRASPSLEEEITRIKQLLETVIEENRQLKAENAQLRSRFTPSTGQSQQSALPADAPTSVECRPLSVAVVCASEEKSPPTKRKAGLPLSSPPQQDSLTELEFKIENRFAKLESMISTLANNLTKQHATLNSKVLALENSYTLPRQASGAGPLKFKPYLRPPVSEGLKTPDPTGSHHGGDQTS